MWRRLFQKREATTGPPSDVPRAERDAHRSLEELARGRGDPWELCGEIAGASLRFGDMDRGINLYLVWQSFLDQTVEDGGEEAARSAMPQAAREWLAAEGDAEQERLYFARWFGYHDLGLDP